MAKESSTELAARLKAEGRWQAFCERKADLEFEGKSKKHAHILAAKEFPPKPGPGVETYGRKIVDPVVTLPVAPPADIDTSKMSATTKKLYEQRGASVSAEKLISPAEKAAAAAIAECRAATAAGTLMLPNRTTLPITPEQMFVDTAKGVGTGDPLTIVSLPITTDAPKIIDANAQMPEPDHAVSAKDFEGKIFNVREDIEWVASNMDIGGLRASNAPSAFAWSFLKACREDANMKFEFFKNIMPKLLPSKSALEEQERFQDDGRKILNILDKVEAASKKARGAEDFA